MRKSLYVIIGILIALVLLRIALPYILIRYVEHQVNKLPEYKVHIADLDVHLYRGSYTLKNIQLRKVNNHIPVPFFAANAVDLSIQWRPLLHGSLVAKVVAIEPVVNFVIDAKKENEQLTLDQQWQEIVKSLFPLNFNKIVVVDGKLYLRCYSGKPPFNLFMKEVNATIENIQNADRVQKKLLSDFKVTAKTMGGANFKIEGQFDPFSKKPTFYLSQSLQNMPIKEANAFLKHYISLDVVSGSFSLYTELAAQNGKVKGYVKPFLKDLKFINPNKPEGALQTLYKGVVSVIAKILENSEQKTVATKVDIEGDLDNPNTSVLSMLGNMLYHAFIQAILPQVEHTVKLPEKLPIKKNQLAK
jgi:hypothetical protein